MSTYFSIRQNHYFISSLFHYFIVSMSPHPAIIYSKICFQLLLPARLRSCYGLYETIKIQGW